MRLNYFSNDKYKLLKYLIDNTYKNDGEVYYQGNQQDLANNVHYSKQKTNFLMQDLCNDGFVLLIDKYHSIYRINKISIQVVKVMEAEI